MERIVQIRREKATGIYLFNPMGTFRRYGAYVGINPYRELPSDASEKELGETVVDLLTKSGPTGYAISDVDKYREETADEITQRIRETYFTGKQTTESMARRFQRLEVATEAKRRSWEIVKFKLDRKLRTMVPDLKSRVKITDGAPVLGQIVYQFLAD